MFPLFFFVAVELPSMAAVALHHGFAKATGRSVRPVNIWIYRVTGVTGIALLLPIIVALGSPAVVLLVVAALGLILYARHVRTTANPRSSQHPERSSSAMERAAYAEVERRRRSEPERAAYIAWLKYWGHQPIPPDVGVQTGLFSRCCARRPCVCGRNEWVPCEFTKMLVKPPMPDGWRPGYPIPYGTTLQAVDWPPGSGANQRLQYIPPPPPTSWSTAESPFTGPDGSARPGGGWLRS